MILAVIGFGMKVYKVQTEDGEQLVTGTGTDIHEMYSEEEIIEDLGPYINNQIYRVLRSENLGN